MAKINKYPKRPPLSISDKIIASKENTGETFNITVEEILKKNESFTGDYVPINGTDFEKPLKNVITISEDVSEYSDNDLIPKKELIKRISSKVNLDDNSLILNGRAVYEFTTQKINTIADLRNTVGKEEGQVVSLLGYYDAGDKEPLNYKWTNTQGVDNGGSVINSENGSWVLIKKNELSVKDFGAKGDGVQDDTNSFIAAKNYIHSLGGGVMLVPFGRYILNNFEIDKPNIVFRGQQVLNGYEEKSSSACTFVAKSNSIFIARLKGLDGVQASYSGFENIMFDGLNNCEYGVFIDSAITILRNCFVTRNKYGVALAAAGNMNIFEDNSFILNSIAGFVYSEEDASSYVHPNVLNIAPVSSTKIIFKKNKIRQNGYGLIIRESANTLFEDCVIESNRKAGLYILRTDISSVYNNTFKNCWFENNYDYSYVNDWDDYHINENIFKISPSKFQPYNKVDNLGFQIIIDSQTRNNSGGSSTNTNFDNCEINPVYDSLQKSVKLISVYNCEFKFCGFTGNTIGRFSLNPNNVAGVKIYKPFGKILNLIEDNYNGIYISSFGNGREGAIEGAMPGPIFFPEISSSDSRVSDPNTLHNYIEGQFVPFISTGSGDSYLLTKTQTSTFTKIGRLIHVESKSVIEVIKDLAAEHFYSELPFPAITDKNIIGRLVLIPLENTPLNSILNAGICDLRTLTTANIVSHIPCFNDIKIGYKYELMMSLTYTSSE